MILGDTILETRGLTKEFKGFIAVNGVNLRVRRGSIHALDRPERRGQNDLLQPAHQISGTDRGTDRLQRHRHHARTAGANCAARHHPFVSDFCCVSASDSIAERAHRLAALARHIVPFLEKRTHRCDELNDRAMDLAHPGRPDRFRRHRRRSNFPMAASARWKSPPRCRWNPNSCCSTNPRKAWAMKTSTA